MTSTDYARDFARKGAQALNNKLSAEERSANARKAATARWERYYSKIVKPTLDTHATITP